MKRLLCVLLILLLVCLLAFFLLWRFDKLSGITDFTDSLFAGWEEFWQRLRSEEPAENVPSFVNPTEFPVYHPEQPVNAALKETICDALLAMESEVNLKDYGISKAELEAVIADIIYSEPALFYVDSSYSYTSNAGQRILKLMPTYTHTPTEVAAMRTEYEAALAEIVANAPQTGSDFDKILYLHDYFVRNYSYDKTLAIHDVYTFFTQKTGVCQAYMLALIAAAEALGLESLPVTSDAMKHAWNLVKIDGAWYHVDITWDDTNTLPTRISYDYFLQSDAGLIAIDAGKNTAHRHYDWHATEAATDTRYDAALFRTANTGIVRYGARYYVALTAEGAGNNVRGTVYSGSDPLSLTKFKDITGGAFLAGTEGYYPDCYCDLYLVDSVLYYHSGNSVGYVDLSFEVPQFRTLSLSGLGVGESVYGFLGKQEGSLTLVIATSPVAEAYRTMTVQIP